MTPGQLTHLTNLMRNFAEEPAPDLAAEIAGILDQPTTPASMRSQLAACFLAVSTSLPTPKDEWKQANELEKAEQAARMGERNNVFDVMARHLDKLPWLNAPWSKGFLDGIRDDLPDIT